MVGNDGLGNPQFGWSVSISEDGGKIVIGGPSDAGGVGASWIFLRNSSNLYNQLGSKLVGSNYSGLPSQGFSVGTDFNGTLAIIGGLNNSYDIGAAWVFEIIT